MKTYWDLSEKDRAALTASEVEKFADAELMTKGVLKVEPPQLDPVPSTPEPDLEVFAVANGHSRADVVFTTAEAARAFLDLKPMIRNSHYLNGEWIYFVDERSADEWKISAERANSKQLADLRKSEFVAAKDVKSRNDKLVEEYDAALKAQQDALADMWSDWRDCGLKAHRIERLIATFENYTVTVEGDRSVAFKFLRKSFTDEQILEAHEWAGFEIPEPFYRQGQNYIGILPAEAPAPAPLRAPEDCIA